MIENPNPVVDLIFNKNDDKMRMLLSALKQKQGKVHLGGGQKSIEKMHAQNKMTARERIKYLLDENSRFFEIGEFAGDGMYEDYGGCPSGGVVAGIESIAPLHR